MSLFSKKPESDGVRTTSEPPPLLNERGARAPGPRAYGIAQAIHLMRSVPVEDNVELVVAVIRSTLESLNIRLSDIIDDASSREHTLHARIETLKGEIADHEKQIDTRSQEIGVLHSELSETTKVKERLLLAQNGAHPAAAPQPPKREPALPPIPQLKIATAPPSPAPSLRAMQALEAVQEEVK
jgi:hypothetical protein